MRGWESRPRPAPLVSAMLLVGALLPVSAPAFAHDFKPALLELREEAPGEWTARLEVPESTAAMLDAPLEVVMPAACSRSHEVPALAGGGARSRWRCPMGELSGAVGLRGLEGRRVDALLRVLPIEGEARAMALSPLRPTVELGGSRRVSGLVGHVGLGVIHILGGLDHLLFVLGLVLLGRPGHGGAARRLGAAITAFTVAHSLTLAASVLALVELPSAPVEACIALSVLVVAVEAGQERETSGAKGPAPAGLAFGFGLLHGFGFAGALREVGFSADALGLSLLGFNLGVELGQLAVLLLLLGAAWAVGGLEQRAPGLERRGRALLVHGLALVAAYWTVARVAAFWDGGVA